LRSRRCRHARARADGIFALLLDLLGLLIAHLRFGSLGGLVAGRLLAGLTGPRRGRGVGLRLADVIGDQRAADLDDVAFAAVHFLDRAGPRTRHFDQRLVGFHLGEGLVLVDGIAGLHPPLDELRLVHAFTEIGKNEVRLVAWLLDSSHGFNPGTKALRHAGTK